MVISGKGGFFANALDEAGLVPVIRYIERNPKRAGLVQHAWDYPWSSAAAHCGNPDTSVLLDLDAWFKEWNAVDWKEQLIIPDDPITLEIIRRQTF